MKLNKLSITIKPSSNHSNLHCSTCFNGPHRENEHDDFMNLGTAHKLIDECFSMTTLDANISFNFQGGELTLIRLQFYSQFIEYVNINREERQIEFSIQTNGLSLNQEWIDLFINNEFQVEVPIDGYAKHHDQLRKQTDGSLTYAQVFKNYQILKDNGVNVSVITVLTNELAMNPHLFYKWLITNQIESIRIIPMIDQPITSLNYYRFYSVLFDLWLEGVYQNKPLRVRLFENLLKIIDHQPSIQCDFCLNQSVVEANGNVYPCYDNHAIGNINTDKLIDIYKVHLSNEGLPERCNLCEYKEICHGFCSAHRQSFMDERGCGYQQFLNMNLDKLFKLYNYMEGKD